MNQHLIGTLRHVGKTPHVYHSPDGTEVLVLPYGGRVLGLFSPESDTNFFWTHAALGSENSAAEFYAGDQWHNSGGDRTWLAPEVDFFFPKFPKTDIYWQPRQLDPGDWHVSVEADAVRLVNRLTHRLSRSNTEVELEIIKSVSPALNPLRHEPVWSAVSNVEYAGYTLRSSLAWINEPRGGPVGLWNLIQMPHGGDLLVPTYCLSPPRVLFGDVRPEDVQVRDHLIRYAMHASGEHKIGIRAIAATGRIGYRYQTADGRCSLIVRNVFVDPSGLYADVPWGDVDDLGYAVQACNVHSALGSFSELEYHVPAIGPGTGRTRCEDVSQTWAFRGDREAINQIMERLLTPDKSRMA
jgi:hypothetical protein